MTSNPPSLTPRSGKERVFDLVERHGNDYVVEGKRLLRRVRRTVTLVGALVGLVAITILALVAYAVLR